MTLVVVKQEAGRLLSLGLPTAATELTGVALVIFGVPAAFAFWRARRAPPNKSRWTAFGGWMLGFWIIPVLCLAVVWVILVANGYADDRGLARVEQIPRRPRQPLEGVTTTCH